MLLIRSKLAGDKQQKSDGETSGSTSDYCGRVPRMLSTTGTTCTQTTSCDRQRSAVFLTFHTRFFAHKYLSSTGKLVVIYCVWVGDADTLLLRSRLYSFFPVFLSFLFFFLSFFFFHFPTKICISFSSLQTSAIELKLNNVLCDLSWWSVTFFPTVWFIILGFLIGLQINRS